MKGKNVEEINIGDSAELTRKFSKDDLLRYLSAIGDPESVPTSDVQTFHTTAVRNTLPEIMTAGLLHPLLDSCLPNPKMRYLSQTLYFRQPVFVGDTITVKVKVTDRSSRENWIELNIIWLNQRRDIVIEGTASVLLPKY